MNVKWFEGGGDDQVPVAMLKVAAKKENELVLCNPERGQEPLREPTVNFGVKHRV